MKERVLAAAGRGMLAGRGPVAVVAAFLAAAAGCAAPGPGPEGPAPAPGEEAAVPPEMVEVETVEGALPPVRLVTGPLEVRVRYPVRGRRIAVRDSNFLFGTTGTGDALLEIDGRPVPVYPNGAFLAWLPVPSPRGGDTAVYRLVARRGTEADTLLHEILLPPRPEPPPGEAAWVDSTALRPPVERWALPDETLGFRVRATPAASAWIEAGARRVGLVEEEPGTYRGAARAGDLLRWACAARSRAVAAPGAEPAAGDRAAVEPTVGAQEPAAGDPGATAEREGARPCGDPAGTDTLRLGVVAAAGGDTARLERPYPLRVLDPGALPVVRLVEEPDSVHGRRGVVVGRPGPFGPYRWRFPPGARASVDGRLGDRLRLRLTPDLAAWVLEQDARPLPPGTPPPESAAGHVRVEPREDRLVLRVGLEVPLPVAVDEPDDRTLAVTLYGAVGATDRVAYGERDDLLESLRWEQLPGGRYRVVVRLREPVWGYRVGYGEAPGGEPAVPGEAMGRATGPDGSDATLRLEIRRPPPVDRGDPLRGRRIAIDPGHPPAGAVGPTGLYEGDANLAIARRLAELLEEEDAVPIFVRRDTMPMGLYERTGRAEEAGAELFVSIHNNALPDGVRPAGEEGTSTYYYHPHSRELAAAVQDGMLAEMGLRDLGILWGDLAVARTSWMPSVLCEGAFMMMPRHEAALRTPEFQERYARGVLRGIRAFLASRAGDGED